MDEEICESCEKPIRGRVFRSADDYSFCAKCWKALQDETAEDDEG